MTLYKKEISNGVSDLICFVVGLLVMLFFLSSCYFLGAPMAMGDLDELQETHCISADFLIGGPPPGGKIEGTIRPKVDGKCQQ